MKSSCIAHPSKEPLIVIHRWQVELCQGNTVAAALLSFFEYWHNIKLDMRAKASKSNDIAETHGDRRTQDESLLQFHSEDELVESIMIARHDKVRHAIKWLVAQGFLSVHRNPNPKYKFDKTRYFLFHPEPINEWLKRRENKGFSVTDIPVIVTDIPVTVTEKPVTVTEISGSNNRDSSRDSFQDFSLSPKSPQGDFQKQERERGKGNSRKKEEPTKEEKVQEAVPTQFNIEPQDTNTLCGNNSLLINKTKSSAGTRDNSNLWDWVPQGEWKLPETGKLDGQFVEWEVDKWQKGSKYDRATIFKLVLREWKKEPALLAIAWEAYRMEAQHRIAATMVTVQAQGKMEECDRAIIDQYLPAAASSSENSPVAASISQNAQSYLSQYQALSTPRLDASSNTEEAWTEQEEQENLEKIKKMRADAIAKAKQNSALHTTKRAKSQ